MKILVIFTGGTIGSTVKDGWISTDRATKYALIEKYKEKFGEKVLFETIEPYFLLPLFTLHSKIPIYLLFLFRQTIRLKMCFLTDTPTLRAQFLLLKAG